MSKQSQNSLPSLTAVRGIAAWWVVLYHFRDEVPYDFFWTPIYRIISHGDFAVDFFFVLSGFIISLNYTERLLQPAWEAYLKFLVARVARIYPLHFFMLIAFLVNPTAIYLLSTAKELGDRYDPVYFLLSLVMVQNWGFTSHLAWNIPSWSISTEWAAYLLFPLNVWLANRFGSSAGRCVVLAGTFLTILALCCSFFGFELTTAISHFGLVRCLTEFGAGMALQRMWCARPDPSSWGYVTYLGAAAGLILLYLFGLTPDFVVLPMAFCFIVLSLASRHGLGRIGRLPILVVFGEISYSTYLVHYFVKDWTKFLFAEPSVPPWLLMLIYLVAVAAASFVLYYIVERPARKAIMHLFSSNRDVGTAQTALG